MAEVTHTTEWKKEYLKSYVNNKRKLESLKMQREELREKIQSVKAVSYSDMPKGSSNQSDLSNYMVKLEELEEKIENLTNKTYDECLKIEKAIMYLKNPNECNVIHMRYINNMKWEEISKKTGYSTMQLHRIHGKALYNIRF